MKYGLRKFSIKLSSWEYWPMWIVYLPAYLYYFYLSVKAKSFFFFSAANPSIETGGMFFESKWDIFKLIPSHYFPKTIFVEEGKKIEEILIFIQQAKLGFPFVAKPDRGERGWAVTLIRNSRELEQYIYKVKVSFLIQELIDYPIELSVFYYRHPNEEVGKITSVTRKQLLSVTGDGKSSLLELILLNDRAFLQLEVLKANESIDFDQVLPLGKEVILVPYGNHVRGAMFLDYNHIIDQKLSATFDSISKQIKDFYFGRFDLRCNSIDELKNGKHFSILELNGSGAEPAHIYQPGFSFFEAQKVIMSHYKMMFDAAIENNKKGVPFMTLQAVRKTKRLETIYKNKVRVV